MSTTGLARFLARHSRIGLDTSLFIYHLNDHPQYRHLTALIFQWVQRRGHSAVTSTITMTELLVHPYRANDIDQVNDIYALASTFPNLEWRPPTLAVADDAARLRAAYGLRTPDALQVAAALASGATGLASNDAALARVRELDVFLLDGA